MEVDLVKTCADVMMGPGEIGDSLDLNIVFVSDSRVLGVADTVSNHSLWV